MSRNQLFFQLKITLLLLLTTSIILFSAPTIDTFVSGLFYANSSFLLTKYSWAGFMPQLIKKFMIFFIVLILIMLLLSLSIKKLSAYRKPLGFIFLTLCLGPGLLVNGLLKNFSGRPRPKQIVMFQGEHDYQKVWTISKQCHHNCSFVCGDCAAIISFLCLMFISPYKKTISTIVIVAASFFSGLRLALGAHFISDIVLAWLLIYLVTLSLYYFFYLSKAANPSRINVI